MQKNTCQLDVVAADTAEYASGTSGYGAWTAEIHLEQAEIIRMGIVAIRGFGAWIAKIQMAQDA